MKRREYVHFDGQCEWARERLWIAATELQIDYFGGNQDRHGRFAA